MWWTKGIDMTGGRWAKNYSFEAMETLENRERKEHSYRGASQQGCDFLLLSGGMRDA